MEGGLGGGSGTCTRRALAGQPGPALCTPKLYEGSHSSKWELSLFLWTLLNFPDGVLRIRPSFANL